MHGPHSLVRYSDKTVRAVHSCKSWFVILSVYFYHFLVPQFPGLQIFSTRYPVTWKVYTRSHDTSAIEHGLSVCTVDNPLVSEWIISPYRRTNDALSHLYRHQRVRNGPAETISLYSLSLSLSLSLSNENPCSGTCCSMVCCFVCFFFFVFFFQFL